MSHAHRKLDKLLQAKRLLLEHPEGINITAIQAVLGVDASSIHRYVVNELHARRIDKGLYTLDPSPEDVALAEAILSRTRA